MKGYQNIEHGFHRGNMWRGTAVVFWNQLLTRSVDMWHNEHECGAHGAGL